MQDPEVALRGSTSVAIARTPNDRNRPVLYVGDEKRHLARAMPSRPWAGDATGLITGLWF